MFRKPRCVILILVTLGGLIGQQSAFAEESEVATPLAEDIVATCGTRNGFPNFGFSIARNNIGAYDIHIQNADTGRNAVKRNWEGYVEQDEIYFTDQSSPSIGSLEAYSTSSDDRIEGSISILDVAGLERGRSIWCKLPQGQRAVISCINNILNNPLHSVDIYTSGSNYQMKIKFLDGYELTHVATGRVDAANVWMFGSGWKLDVSWRPNFWWGPLTGPDGRSNDMVCFR